MKSAIEGILYGNWGRSDYIPRTAELSKQADIVEKQQAELEALLKKMPKALEALKSLVEEIDEETCLEVCDFYKAGFRNGFFLAMDVFGLV